jgi:hypothetical protein
MYYLKITTLIFICTGAVLLTGWLFFRPGAKKYYDACGQIPLKNNLKLEGDK